VADNAGQGQQASSGQQGGYAGAPQRG